MFDRAAIVLAPVRASRLQTSDFRLRTSRLRRPCERVDWTAVSPVQDAVPGRTPPTSATAAWARSSRSTTTRAVHLTRGGDRAASEEPVALPRTAPDHRRAAHRLSLGITRRWCAAIAWPGRSASASSISGTTSVNHPTLLQGIASSRSRHARRRARVRRPGMRASTGNLANSVAAHAARLGIECCVFIPDNLEAGSCSARRSSRPTIPRHRRQLRRRQSAVHARSAIATAGASSTSTCTLLLRRRRRRRWARDRPSSSAGATPQRIVSPVAGGTRCRASCAACASFARSGSSAASCPRPCGTGRRLRAGRRTPFTPGSAAQAVRPDTIARVDRPSATRRTATG
mgnify:CR=1 FL=1